MAYTEVQRYQVEQASIEEAARQVVLGFVPLASQAPGLVGCRVLRTDDGQVVTVSTFVSRTEADAPA